MRAPTALPALGVATVHGALATPTIASMILE